MPQLSPMLSFLIFITILFFYIVLLSGLSKKFPFIHQTKMSKSFKKSFKVFK
uniref:ATP synthase F0 subunit 8 n=1 Tax=Hypselodoris festiva TaxID=1884254 RepID=A0A1B1YY30_9GAST|nr:ATP synthase F0 subunit 8 [Hypselodoris festiva]ANX10023.1 ATP synthase F0 subunit 8 [Hypselodoris festiva]